ncbi:MAG: PEP-CTERM sorting domain-containing protein [Proteobacteria bacterium]|nr:PEP-CTERM sorting domain-containing protein [Pseudomonadota bacterium]
MNMCKVNTKKLSLAMLCMFFASASQATIIDFESVTTDEFTVTIVAEGYDWVFSAGGWFIGPHDTAFCADCTSNGTSNLVAAGGLTNANVIMTRSGGAAFDIFSLDAATANSTEVGNELLIEGIFSGGGTISATFGIDGTFDFYALTGFVDLVSVTFSSVLLGSYNFGGFSIDNLNDSPTTVPEPGTLALLGIGLFGMGWARRRKKV